MVFHDHLSNWTLQTHTRQLASVSPNQRFQIQVDFRINSNEYSNHCSKMIAWLEPKPTGTFWKIWWYSSLKMSIPRKQNLGPVIWFIKDTGTWNGRLLDQKELQTWPFGNSTKCLQVPVDGLVAKTFSTQGHSWRLQYEDVDFNHEGFKNDDLHQRRLPFYPKTCNQEYLQQTFTSLLP